ncbi:Stage II sporulation protein P [anaerobic digester metagenome]
MFSYRKYNQQLSTGALLLEFGSHANTLDEAKHTAVLTGEALAQVLLKTQPKGS